MPEQRGFVRGEYLHVRRTQALEFGVFDLMPTAALEISAYCENADGGFGD